MKAVRKFSVEQKPLNYTRNEQAEQEKRQSQGLPPKRVALNDALRLIFTEILPLFGYALREKQLELAGHILGVIGKRGVTLAEAEVGTGKTHAYLLAALLAKRGRINDYWLRGYYPKMTWAKSAYMPVVISTSSIALQQAIVTDYIPELSRILMLHGIIDRPLVAVVRKGREHYICESRLQRHYRNADKHTQRLLEPYNGINKPFDLTNSKGLTPYVKRAICVSGQCDKNCPHAKECRYTAYIKEANSQEVDFQITNHNYFLADRLHRVSGKKPLLPNYQLVIIDEAHKFLQAARQMYSVELSSLELPELAEKVHNLMPDAPDKNPSSNDEQGKKFSIHKLTKSIRKQCGKLFQKFATNIQNADFEVDDEAERLPAIMDSDVMRHIKSIAGLCADTLESIQNAEVGTHKKAACSKAIWKLTDIIYRLGWLRKLSKHIYWIENRLEGEIESQALCAIPKDLDERLYKDLWSCGIPIVLTSGTLSASGDFTRTKETLGLNRLEKNSPTQKLFSTTMKSPFDYKNNTLLYISENMPFPDNKDKAYITAVADEIEKLVTASHGHAAVLFTSYNAMGQVHAILKQRNLPFPLFRLERGGTSAIDDFKKSGNGILLASGSLWEGIDIPGDALSMLIIVKLPFAVPDPISEYEKELCGDMNIYKQRAIIPDMLVKLMQGFGRLIRKVSDTGVVAILDCRASEHGAYRSRILATLPKCKVTSKIPVVKRFIKDKKPKEYYE